MTTEAVTADQRWECGLTVADSRKTAKDQLETRFSEPIVVDGDLQFSGKTQKMGRKMNRQAISWIQGQCIIKGLSLQTNFLAITLFYRYTRTKKPQAHDIEPVLITCLLMACKMHHGPIQSVTEALNLVHTHYSPETIKKLQLEILTMVDYNLIIPNQLTRVQLLYETQPDLYNALCFCIEILLLRDEHVLFDPHTIDELLTLLTKLDSAKSSVAINIKQMLEKQQSQILVSKYRSKIDLNQILRKFRSI